MMKMITKKKITTVAILLFFVTLKLKAQSESLTSSPYSLYGLGTINQTSIGKSNSMGYSGIGLKTTTEINNLNPANFALTPKNSFFYDIGITAETNTFANSADDQSKTTFNFSNIAMAFRIMDNLGMGIVMTPYSDVGYSLVGIKTNIEGSTETFESNVTGLGGLSDLKLNVGYGITDKLNVGFSTSFLFGSITEEESFTLNTSGFQLSEKTNYNGIRLGFGFLYDITKSISIGGTAQLPTTLNGTLKRSAIKYIDGVEIDVEEDSSDDADSFKMPLEIGFGLSSITLKNITLTADYKKNFWTNTNQSENIGSYEDQNIYAFGLEYLKDIRGYKYKDRIRYRAGFNYNDGYLAINDEKISGYDITAGIGIPVGKSSNSTINLSYSYGSKGQIENILIKEDYHQLTINFSLEDLWFKKRKIY